MVDKDDIDFRERWKEKSRRMFDNSEAKKAFQNVFEDETLDALLKLADDRQIQKVYGTIESGKESLVFLADTPNGERVLLKIYMTRAGPFREMKQYLQGDRRFREFKDNRKHIIYEWCKKEYKNLKKAQNVLKAPRPIAHRKNILIMEFIGKDYQPYPKIKDVEIENPEKAQKIVLNQIKKLWQQEELVHGDLSEYNILVDQEGNLTWIDFSQGVHKTHPEAKNLLKRDIENITNFFHRQGAQPANTQKELQKIVQE